MAAAVTATLLGAAPPEDTSRGHTKLPKPKYGKAVAFQAKPQKTKDPAAAAATRTRKQAATKPAWPAPGSATVELSTAAGQKAKASSLPVTLAAPVWAKSTAKAKAKAAEVAQAPARAKVTVLDRKLAKKLGIEGLVLSVQRTDGKTNASSLSLSVDYSGFAHAYGGAWASRLRAIELPACALTTPDKPQCRTTQVLPTSNDAENGSLTTQVTTRQATSAAATTTVVALAAAASSDQGSYQATPLSVSSTWAGGSSNGDFTWSYPMDAVPAPAGTTPTVALGYSAQSVDGRTSSTSAQPSWVGEGFDLPTSYIERSYGSCDDDGQDGKADLCWKEHNASVVLNGKSSPLIKDANGWHLKNDDGEKITLATGAVNGDSGDTGTDGDQGEYWTLTTTDGTQYVFGKNRLPGWSDNGTATDDPVTNSTWTVPVFGDDPGEPGYSSSTSFAGRAKLQAWRWNLDYVVDPHGNVTSYWYTKEGNYYAKNASTGNGTYYDRGGWLKRIDYGQRSNTIYSKPAAARVKFTVAERCIPVTGGETCATLTETNKAAWPDVPFDQICAANTVCTDRTAPSFFSRKRLTDVTTQVYKGTGTGVDTDYRDVNTWHMEHSFPDPGDGSAPGLWLKSIRHTGKSGTTPITLPAVTFEGIQMHNRVDKTGDDVVPYIKWRVRKVTSETGSVVTVNYSDPECIADTNLPTALDKNTKRCYPVKWIPPTNPTSGENPQPRTDFFHKYVVTQVTESDPTGGAPLKETNYTYTGGGAWAYDDESPITQTKYRTWSIWRGYNTVTTTVGAASGTRSKTTALYYRGMHGDKQTSGTRSETITDSQGVSKTDSEEFAGQLREQITYNGASGQEVSAKVITPWSQQTSSDNHSYGTVRGYMVRTGTEVTRTRLNSGSTITTTSTTTYDTKSGMPLTVETDAGGAKDCTRTWYATDETKWMLSYPKRVEKVSVGCSAAPNRTNDPKTTDLVSETRLSYDSQAYAAAPTTGNVTRTERLTGYNTDGSGRYQTVTTSAYDEFGRPTDTWNTKGTRTKHITYTPATGGPITQTETTNAAGHTAVAEHAPDWGVDLARTDANGNRTELAYDALGRLTDVWLADRNRADGQTPSHKYEYKVQSGAASWVATKSLNQDGTTYLTQYAIYDALMRPRQVQLPAATGTGRVISETKYDSRGLAVETAAQYIDTTAPSGTLATLITAAPAGTETIFDGAGRPTVQKNLVKGQEHSRTTTTYDGHATTVLPPAGAPAVREEYDSRGRLAEKREYNGSTVTADYTGFTYSYDHADRLQTVKDDDGNTWSYGYDFLGRQTSASDPDAGGSTTEYNDLDQVVAATDARKKTIGYTYDSLGRQTARVDGPVPLVGGVPTPDDAKILARWSYDTIAKGQLTSTIRYVGGKTGDVYAITNADYDELYRVLKEQYTISTKEGALAGTGVYVINNTYNLDGTLQKRTIPAMGGLAAETLTYGYTPTRLPDTLQGLTGIVQNTDYLPAGEHIRTTLGVSSTADWTEINYAYEDGTQRLARQTVVSETRTGTDADIYYRYDKAGNPTEIDDRSTSPGDKQCFAYDGHRRLKTAWTAVGDCATAPTTSTVGGRAPYWQSFTYDSAGNRKTATDHLATGGPATTTYTYKTTDQNRPHALASTVTSMASGTQTMNSYTYWENGATKTRNLNGTTQTLDWDVEGELAKVTEASGATTTFLNNGDGNRLIRRDTTGTTLYLGETELRLDKASGKVTATRYYTHAGKTVAMRTPSNLTWLSTDHHDTASLQIDATTQALTRRPTKPFGEDRGAAKPAAWRGEKGFVGGSEDPTGLTHLGAREYDTTTGRFISVDPIGDLKDPQQINGYAYSNNNPITFSDPDGEFLGSLIGVIIATVIVTQIVSNISGNAGGGGAASSSGMSTIGSANYSQNGFTPGVTCITPGKYTFHVPCGSGHNHEPKNPQKLGGWKEAIAGVGHWLAEAAEDMSKASPVCWFEDCSGATDAYEKFVDSKGVDTDSSLYKDTQTRLDIYSFFGGGGAVRALGKKLLKTGGKKNDVPLTDCECFLAGTAVLMADGETKSIEDINLGDKVLATDPKTGEQGPREVTSLIVTENDKHFNELSIVTESGIEKLTATHEHPFWSPSELDWIPAADLQPGMTLRTDDGDTVIVTANRAHTKNSRTYNLTVDDLHTYYVLAGATPVLVHNCGGALLNRARELYATRADEASTVAVARVRNVNTGRSETWVATERTGLPDEWRGGNAPLRGERYIPGQGHAEATIMNRLGSDWEITGMASSTRMCPACFAQATGPGVDLTPSPIGKGTRVSSTGNTPWRVVLGGGG
ncbi:polymorphic toxin-type HINT domain-containing protein [Streptomyces sp. enrichment culture]|uniref:polymorphic toxin-type HINT domain-containing protein n=1 Tax=Streptomyces sp. enrichment culture TaxID=1795815 RepID=UPI003F567F9B